MFPEEFRERGKLQPHNSEVNWPLADASSSDLGAGEGSLCNPSTPQSARAEADNAVSPAATVPLTGNTELSTPISCTRKRVIRSPSISSFSDAEIPDGYPHQGLHFAEW
jgi:hypothetical protein